MANKPNFVAEAIKKPGNMVFLALFAGLSLVIGGMTGIVIASVAAAVETTYVLLRANNKGFRRKILRKTSWGGDVTPAMLDRMADKITEKGAVRYRLFRKHVNVVIDAVEARDMDEDPLIQGILANLQSMSLSYLKLLLAETELMRMQKETSAESLKKQIADLDGKIEQAVEVQLIFTYQQSRDLLARQLSRLESADDQRQRITSQLDLMDSTAQSLGAQTADLTSPTDIGAQVHLALANMQDARVLEGELDSMFTETPELAAVIPPRQGVKS